MTNIDTLGNSGSDSKEVVFKDAKYSIIKEGSLSYIVNNDGVKVSNGYHEIFSISHENIKVLIGRSGSQRYVLKIPEKYEDFIDESPEGFHEIFYNKEIGHWVGKSGAMTYILDIKTGKAVTEGYHTITKSAGVLYGKTGARTEKVLFISDLNYENEGEYLERGNDENVKSIWEWLRDSVQTILNKKGIKKSLDPDITNNDVLDASSLKRKGRKESPDLDITNNDDLYPSSLNRKPRSKSPDPGITNDDDLYPSSLNRKPRSKSPDPDTPNNDVLDTSPSDAPASHDTGGVDEVISVQGNKKVIFYTNLIDCKII